MVVDVGIGGERRNYNGTLTHYETLQQDLGSDVFFGGLDINVSEARQTCGMIFLQQHVVAWLQIQKKQIDFQLLMEVEASQGGEVK